ncbi:MAG: YihY/virulence factor BrkB family protein [Clostridiales bacterium]|nr:YihY/virulence factor BrkB family protein [Clostridiales bacterium]
MNFFQKIFDKYDPIISKCNHDNVYAIAGQSAFFMLLSAVPLLMFLVSLLQNLHIPVEFIELGLNGIFSEEIVTQVSEFLSDAYNSAVGISFITLIVTLWSASQGMHALTNGLNRIYNAYENRTWIYLRIRAMIYTLIFFLIILMSIVVVVFGSSLNDWLSPYVAFLPNIVAGIYHLRYVLLFAFIVVIFALIYRNFPNISRAEHREYGFKYQLPGALLCTLSWYVLSFVISTYVNNFNGFSIYRSLTGFAVIMIWLYFCMASFMICAEINYVYHDVIKSFSLKKIVKKLFDQKY